MAPWSREAGLPEDSEVDVRRRERRVHPDMRALLAEAYPELEREANVLFGHVRAARTYAKWMWAAVPVVLAIATWLGVQILGPGAVAAATKRELSAKIEEVSDKSDRNYNALNTVNESQNAQLQELRAGMAEMKSELQFQNYLTCVQLRRADPAAVPSSCNSAAPPSRQQ